MSDVGQSDWAKHAAAEGAAVSADPGESGDVIDAGGGAPDAPVPAPSNHLAEGGDPVEGGRAGDGASGTAEPAPSNHLTGGGDPVEGKR